VIIKSKCEAVSTKISAPKAQNSSLRKELQKWGFGRKEEQKETGQVEHNKPRRASSVDLNYEECLKFIHQN